MSCRVLSVSPAEPRADRIQEAVSVLRSGGIVALPTETFYGLAADSFNSRAVDRLNVLKGKAEGSPVLLLVADVEQVGQVATNLPVQFGPLSETFWPGPLTLVVPASERLPRAVSGGGGTVGLRVPGLSLPRQIAAVLGRPITGVSANLHGEPPCRTARAVARMFPQGVDLVLDGGPTAGRTPSTVLDLCPPQPRVLREGTVPTSALKAFVSL